MCFRAAAERGHISDVTDNRHLVGRAGRRSKDNLQCEETIDTFNGSSIVNINLFCLIFFKVVSSRSS